MAKLFIIGLDCAEPSLVFERWREDLPNLVSLMKEGVYGRLRSTIPPITVPAWTSMLTGKDPGVLGFYGFRNRKPQSYDLFIPNMTHLREKPCWEILSERGLQVILLGIPQTYPPKRVNGIMVSSFLTPDKSKDYTYPREIKDELDQIADGDYIIDIRNFRTEDKKWLLGEIYKMTQRRFKVVKEFIRRKPWDFFMFVEMGIDRIHHGFWRYMDRDHRLYEPNNPFENAIFDYYVYVDKEIGELLEILPEEASVMVVSDHGAKRMKGAIAINDWLIERGYLVLKERPNGRMRLDPKMIDWERTKVWAEGGYYSRIFINVKGREPQGIVPPEEYEAFREKLKEEIEAIPDDKGGRLSTKAFKPEEIYRSCNGFPPDLIVYFDNLNWRGAGTVGNASLHLFENDTGPDDANHAQDGVFIFRPSKEFGDFPYEKGEELKGLEIYDVAPTVLGYFGFGIPEDWQGKSILGEGGRAEAAWRQQEVKGYSEEEEEEISKRLADLGYY